ncbi:proteasome assembly chaperone family protein [Haladaptatus halobius]|uniref:proteasome assembly chaperone family protein n=1 Tax=Haladaptatus halobius TaxID=2884875 RepID=UPI001D09A7D6|nr:PAC2 family protein [Haladaptatus halobius]
MPTETPTTTFHQVSELESPAPTLIEGLPGHGLVASIAADHITKQLGLTHHGAIRSDAFSSVASFAEGRIQDTIRVSAGADPAVMTLQSDVPIPEDTFTPLSQCVLEELADGFSRAIFLAGAPAQAEDQIGDVRGVATTEAVKQELADAGIPIADDPGAVNGVTGALVNACYQEDVPAALLLVQADPRLPDPAAARAVIENALEPLVEFEITTDELREQADRIQEQKQQISQQFQHARNDEQAEPRQTRGMYQ